MYCQHFGLERHPYKITPDTSLFYSGGDRGAVLEAVSYAILSGAGITKVIGEVGSGKTMLCRMLESKLRETVDTIYIANPGISPENILNVIAFEVGLIKTQTGKLEAMQVLQDWLLQRHAEGRQVVVLIEEAQAMPLETLEEIRLLSNLETEQDKLMQIVLFGQPELETVLSNASIRQLAERIVHSFYLAPLKKEYVRDYLNFRVCSAGGRRTDLFNDETASLIAARAKGLIRRINILADKSLLAAYSESSHSITRKHVKTAIKDSRFRDYVWGNVSYQSLYMSAALVCLIVIGIVSGKSLFVSTPESDGMISRAEASKPLLVNTPVSTGLQTGENGENTPSSKAVMSSLEEMAADDIKTERYESDRQWVLEEQDILERRLHATSRWLNNDNANRFSIQIMLVHKSSEEQLRRYIARLSENIDMKDIYIYESVLHGKHMYGVLYKAVENRQLARQIMNEMPTVMHRHKPFILRTAHGIRNEINQTNG